MYAHLATMSTDDDDIIVVPMNMLPAEEDSEDVEAQKKFIRERIIPETNRNLVNDSEAWKLVLKMGSDLSINAFAINFKINGRVNQNVFEANYLNKRIFDRLSVSSTESLNEKPLILTSTQFAQKPYGACLSKFKERLGLPQGSDNLYTLVNVVMSPWPTATGLINEVADSLRQVILEERKVVEQRNTISPDYHGFLMQGTDDHVFLVHFAMFNMENHRQQLIITGKLPEDVMQKYINARETNKQEIFTLRNMAPTTLEDILAKSDLDVVLDIGIPEDPNA